MSKKAEKGKVPDPKRENLTKAVELLNQSTYLVDQLRITRSEELLEKHDVVPGKILSVDGFYIPKEIGVLGRYMEDRFHAAKEGKNFLVMYLGVIIERSTTPSEIMLPRVSLCALYGKQKVILCHDICPSHSPGNIPLNRVAVKLRDSLVE